MTHEEFDKWYDTYKNLIKDQIFAMNKNKNPFLNDFKNEIYSKSSPLPITAGTTLTPEKLEQARDLLQVQPLSFNPFQLDPIYYGDAITDYENSPFYRKPKCDCGAWKTYGEENCTDASHSTWCRTLNEKS